MNAPLLDVTTSLLLCLTYKAYTQADEAIAFILYTQCLSRLLSSHVFFFLIYLETVGMKEPLQSTA